MRETIRKGLW